jgi:hypothetical protein
MNRSPMLDVVLVSAVMVGATALLSFVVKVPEQCPKPDPSSVERLLAPCLVADRADIPSPADFARFDLPPPPFARGQTAIVTPREPSTPTDVEVTGSVPRPGR